MRIHSITIRNYRPFRFLEETTIGQLTTIVGKNDAGKSSVLRAIQIFFEDKPKIEKEDIHDGAPNDENIVIEIAFTNLPPKIQIEEGVETTLEEEMLLDLNQVLRIRKTYPRADPTKAKISLITRDFQNGFFAGLTKLKESEINKRCQEKKIDVTKSGRGITNKSKRKELRRAAEADNIKVGQYELIVSDSNNWKLGR